MNHATDACQNDHERQSKVKLAEFQERPRLHILAASVEFRILKAHLIEAVQGKFGYKQRREHRKHDTDCQRRRKALDGTGTHKVQHYRCNQRRYVAVDNRGQCFLKTDLNRRFYSFASCDFFPDSGKNNDVCIDCHTDRQDDTCDTGQSQGNIKAIQQQNNQHRVNAQCDGACNTGNPVNSDHENNNNRKTNCTGNQARTDRC